MNISHNSIFSISCIYILLYTILYLLCIMYSLLSVLMDNLAKHIFTLVPLYMYMMNIYRYIVLLSCRPMDTLLSLYINLYTASSLDRTINSYPYTNMYLASLYILHRLAKILDLHILHTMLMSSTCSINNQHNLPNIHILLSTRFV